MEERVGGTVEFKFLRPDGKRSTMQGRILGIISCKKLSYSWNFDSDKNSNEVVKWMLEPVDGSSTQVTLMHAGFQKQNEKDVEAGFFLEASWTQFLSQLLKHCKEK